MNILGTLPDRARTHSAVAVKIDAIPSTLRERRRWVAWKYLPRTGSGKPQKVPYQARTGRKAWTTNPAHWCDFPEAFDALGSDSYEGLGYVFAHGDGLVGVDLDACRDRDSGELTAAASTLLADLNTYGEVSPSGTGVKLYAAGEIDRHGPKRRGGVEVYGGQQFFAVTGQHLNGTPHEVLPAGDVVRRLQASLGGRANTTPSKELGGAVTSQDERVGTGFRGTDDELLKRAFAAQNGPKLAAYFAGDPCGKPSLSESLLGLAQMLAFWTGRDPDRLERLVCSSQLYLRAESERVKWLSRRGPDSWGMRYVVLKAIGTCAAFYSCSPLASPLPTEQRPNRVSSGSTFDFVRELLERVVARPVPPFIVAAVTSRKGQGQLAQQRLAALCLALDQHNGGGFFLSSVDAGKLLGVSQTAVSRWLTKFRTLRLIRRTQKGNGIGGIANCYVWTGPLS